MKILQCWAVYLRSYIRSTSLKYLLNKVNAVVRKRSPGPRFVEQFVDF